MQLSQHVSSSRRTSRSRRARAHTKRTSSQGVQGHKKRITSWSITQVRSLSSHSAIVAGAAQVPAPVRLLSMFHRGSVIRIQSLRITDNSNAPAERRQRRKKKSNSKSRWHTRKCVRMLVVPLLVLLPSRRSARV